MNSASSQKFKKLSQLKRQKMAGKSHYQQAVAEFIAFAVPIIIKKMDKHGSACYYTVVAK